MKLDRMICTHFSDTIIYLVLNSLSESNLPSFSWNFNLVRNFLKFQSFVKTPSSKNRTENIFHNLDFPFPRGCLLPRKRKKKELNFTFFFQKNFSIDDVKMKWDLSNWSVRRGTESLARRARSKPLSITVITVIPSNELWGRHVKRSRSLSGHEARFQWKSCGPGVTYAGERERRGGGGNRAGISWSRASSFLCPRQKRAWNRVEPLPVSCIELHLACTARHTLRSTIHEI